MTSLLACFCVFVSSFLPSLKDKRCLKLFISLRREASIQEDLDKTKKCVSFRTKGRWHQTLLVFKESLSNDCLLRSLPTPVPEPGCAEVNAHSISALILGLARAMAKGLYKHVLATCEDSSGDELGAEPGSAQEAWPGRSHGVGSGQAPGAPPETQIFTVNSHGLRLPPACQKRRLCLSIFSSQKVQRIPFIKLPWNKSMKHNPCVL